MPVPGPRIQTGPLPGFRNPEDENPDRINPWEWPHPIVQTGRSPGTMFHSVRGNILGAGQVRRMWRQAIDYIQQGQAFSWTGSGNAQSPPPLGITRALRYMTRSLYAQANTDNTRMYGVHTEIKPKVRSKPVTTQAGNMQGRPTVRNRLTSFGSRVPPINPKLPPGVAE